MASSTIRKAIGVVKDQTSISIAKVAGNLAPDLEVLIVKATNHDNEPPEEKYTREILNLTSYSRSYVTACVFTLSKRLSKTHDWIVALKAVMLIHRLLTDGDPAFCLEILSASRKGARVLNLSDFHDETHSNSWDHSWFVKNYALFLDKKLEFIHFEQKVNGDHGSNQGSRSYNDLNELRRSDRKVMIPVMEMKTDKVLERLNHLLCVLDRVLSCRPLGNSSDNKMIFIALTLIMKETFRVYDDMSESLQVLLDRFPELEYEIGVKIFDELVYAAKMSDELAGFYDVCKNLGGIRSFDFPTVQMISEELLGGLETSLREKKNESNNEEIKEISPDMSEIKALPPPESYHPPPPPPLPPVTAAAPVPCQQTKDLVNLKGDDMSADAHGNKLALALFSAPKNVDSNSSWEAFSSNDKADWEIALVESVSNLSSQHADMAGGLDSLVLNGMYDQGTVTQHANNSQLTSGSSSSVVMPAKPVLLALPAPDGTLQPVGPHDPFAASLAVPPPAYVQIADMEKKQNLLVQEEQMWKQYGSNGMQGQGAFTRINASVSGYSGQQAGYHYYYA